MWAKRAIQTRSIYPTTLLRHCPTSAKADRAYKKNSSSTLMTRIRLCTQHRKGYTTRLNSKSDLPSNQNIVFKQMDVANRSYSRQTHIVMHETNGDARGTAGFLQRE